VSRFPQIAEGAVKTASLGHSKKKQLQEAVIKCKRLKKKSTP